MDKMQEHFKPIYYFIAGISAAVMLYVIAVTWIPMPKENQRFVDIAFGFLLNLVGQAVNYLTGGSPVKKAELESKHQSYEKKDMG